MTGLVAFSCLVLFTFGFWTLLLRARVCPSVLASIHGCSGKNFSFHLVTLPKPFALGNVALGYSFYAILGSTVDTGSSTVFGGFVRISNIFFVKVSSDPAVVSRPALLGSFGSCSLEKCAQSLVRLRGLLELVALGIWTLFSRAPSVTWQLFQDCMRRVRSELITQVMSSSCFRRRLRSWWRHEQQTVAVLATVTHHSHSKMGTANAAQRGQETVTSTREGGTAGVGHRPSAAGTGPAAHRGPDG